MYATVFGPTCAARRLPQTSRTSSSRPSTNPDTPSLENWPVTSRRRNAFAAALGAQWQQGAKPDRVRVPVLQCYPVGASSSLKETYLRGAWIAGQVFTVWVACGFKPWLADVGAEANDLLLVWAVEAGLEAGEAGKEGEGAVGGGGGCRGLGLRVHLVRRADVGSDKLEALVGLVCVW